MKDFENFDRKSFRKEKFDSRKKDKRLFQDNHEEYRFAKLNKKQIKQKIQDIQEEEKWEDWTDYDSDI